MTDYLSVALDDVPARCSVREGAFTKSQQHVMRNCYEPVFTWDTDHLTSSFFEDWTWNGRRFRGNVRPRTFWDGTSVSTAILADVIEKKLMREGLSPQLNCLGDQLEFTVTEPYGPLLSVLTQEDALVVSEDERGTGVYRIGHWEKDLIQIEKASMLPQHKSMPKAVNFRPYTNVDDIMASLLDGETDVAYELPYAVLRDGHRRLDIQIHPIHSINSLQFNCRRLSREVRRAIRTSIDWHAILDRVHENVGTVPHGILPPATVGYDPTLAEYDVTRDSKSASLQGLRLDLLTRPSPISSDLWATAIADALRPLGASLSVHPLSVGDTITRMRDGNFDLAQLGFQIGPEPFSFFRDVFSTHGPANLTGFQSDEVDRLVQEARLVGQESDRRQVYAAIQRIVLDEVPIIGTRHGYAIIASRVERPVPLRPHPDGMVIVERGNWS